jgi:HNH endonuclease
VNWGDARLPERFWQKVAPCPMSGCWLWAAAQQGNGYGTYKFYGKTGLVHRYVYRELVGEIPAGLQLDHLCRQRCCCNPNHLEPVTPAVNVQRSTAPEAARRRHAAVTHCPSGHEYTPANTIRWENDWRRHRVCRVCSTNHKREYVRRKRAEQRAA